MHSFHQSRGRIAFDVFCALTIAGSCVGAWMQTGATAFLPAAAVAAFYGVVLAFGLRIRHPAAVQPTDMAPTDDRLSDTMQNTVVPDPEPESTPASAGEEVETKKTKARAAKNAGNGKRKVSKRPAQAAAENLEAAVVEVPAPEPATDMAPVPIAPLFEPEPFVRQQRAVFGRKAG